MLQSANMYRIADKTSFVKPLPTDRFPDISSGPIIDRRNQYIVEVPKISPFSKGMLVFSFLSTYIDLGNDDFFFLKKTDIFLLFCNYSILFYAEELRKYLYLC